MGTYRQTCCGSGLWLLAMGFSGSFIVARAVRPVTELAGMQSVGCVPCWWARDGEWQILQACPGGDSAFAIVLGQTGAPVLVADVIDSDFASVEAASPQGLSWHCALSPKMARGYNMPEEWIGAPAEVAERAEAWAREAGLQPDPAALRTALEAECDPLAEDLVLALVHALGFRFGDAADLEPPAA